MNLALDDRERALAKLESLLATSPVGIAFLDHELRFIRVNEALATIHGRSAVDHVGCSIHDVLPHATRLEPVLRNVLQTGETVREIEVGSTERSLLAHYFPVRSLDGAIIGVGGMVVENTDRRRVEDELRHAVQLREDVLAVVSHDLRSPLATIELAATMLGLQLGTDPRVRNHLAVMQRSVIRMRHMIDDLLDSASIREGRLALELRYEPADSLMTEALDLHEGLAAERALRVQRFHNASGVMVHCDRLRILQVFGNLMGNSIKFCASGGAIVVMSRIVEDVVEFSVRDDGPGINADAMPGLFAPYRLPPSQAHAGSGLGLHISKGIIERHHGTIWAESEPGRGTTIYFTLPIAT